MKGLFFCLVILMSTQAIFAQCLNKTKIDYGGNYDFVNYMFLTPSYTFAYKGDTSKNWNVLNDDIDIVQAPGKVMVYKKFVENAIIKYSGKKFYSDLKFIDVEVSYPEKFQTFKDSGRTDMVNKFPKAKYFYHYQFNPIDTVGYLIGIAVNKNGKIISPFTFPSKKYYQPINKNFTYCQLIEIARKTQKDIDPIEKISLEYDKINKKFYWLISRELVNEKAGINYINQVEINAANLSDVKRVKSEMVVTY